MFRKENPVIAYGSEIAGSIPTMLGGGAVLRGIQGAKKLADASKVGQAVKSGAVSGGIYGAGTGEGAEGKALGVATGGALGGVLGGATAKIFPKPDIMVTNTNSPETLQSTIESGST